MKLKSYYLLASTLAMVASNPTIADESIADESKGAVSSNFKVNEEQRPEAELKMFKLSLDDNWLGESSAHRGVLSGKALSQEEVMELLQREGRLHPSKMTVALDDGEAREIGRFQSELTADGVMLSEINQQLQRAKYQWETCLETELAEGAFTFCISSPLIPNRYLIQLDRRIDTKELASVASELTSSVNGRLDYLYDSVFHGFSGVIDKEGLARLENEPMVIDIQRDNLVHLHTIQNPVPSWGMDRIDERPLNLDSRFTYQENGAGVDVYVIDSGLRASHLDFSGRVGTGASFVGGSPNTDCIGHGTHVAGTTLGTRHGLAKGATIHPVRVFGCSNSTSTATIVAGVNWVTANAGGTGVANMSLGGGVSTAIDSAVQTSINSGVTYVVSAGNSNANACGFSPARVNDAITVGSTTDQDKRSSFSNKGSCVDIFAPGSDITSAWIGSNTATNTISGTSMSAPHVTGIAALLLAQNPVATPADIMSQVIGDATTGVLSSIGSGSPNLMAFWKQPCTDPVIAHDGSVITPWFDSQNCYVTPVPSGHNAFIWSGKYYVEPSFTDCPLGSYDGANCYVMTKPSTGFIYANNFYHQYDACSVGSDDSANCYIASAAGGTTAFEWGGNFYTTPLPGNVCPIGSFDGANCYVMTKPATGFIYANNFYSEYNACSIGSDDSANCYIASAPAGTTAFIYAGNFYTTPTGVPSCPSNSIYDGANCFIATAPNGSSPFIWGGSFYYAD